MRQAEARAPARIGAIAVWALLGAVLAAVALWVVIPRSVGGTPYVVLTGSMRPSMPPGTLVVTRPVAEPAIGDVVTYQLRSGEPTVVTHRIVGQGVSAAGETVYRTRGDANRAADREWVRPVQIRGKRWYAVPYLGYAGAMLGADQRLALARIAAAALLGYAAVMLAPGLARVAGAGRGRHEAIR